jgi:hypothetical protein
MVTIEASMETGARWARKRLKVRAGPNAFIVAIPCRLATSGPP